MSYACNAAGKANLMLSPHDLYLQLGDNDAARQRSYRALFDAHAFRKGLFTQYIVKTTSEK